MKEHNQMVTRCRFKRTEESEWEGGVAIGPDTGDVDVIVTFTGLPVKEVWKYERQEFEGLLWVRV